MAMNYPIVGLAVFSAALAIAVIVLSVSLDKANKANQSNQDPSTVPPGLTTTMQTPTTTVCGPVCEPWESDYRLPIDTLPLHYEIYLWPDLSPANTGTFDGNVDIHINVTNPRDFLLVHTKFLEIQTTRLYEGHGLTGAEIPVREVHEYPRNEFWVVKLESTISPGNYTLSMKFKGSLTKDIVGFYRSEYFKSDAIPKRAIATSKFEPTYARRAFPCMDEPSFKSTFGVTLVRPKDGGYEAYSNMPQISKQDDVPQAGLTTVKFDTSVPMVTYLACFIVADFDARNATTKRGIPIRTISRSNQFESTYYPLEIGVKVTDFYEDYFDIPYALPKQDLIAIPDFVSGAMEHWGLVTFRETALLFSPTESSTANQKRVATVVAHELAHQWFGNLMTIIWWDDLWLNEGFASYMEYKGTDYAEPSWDIMTHILTDDLGPVLKLDAKLSSHPIVQTVNHPDEITEIFDTISYSKGASVLFMLENFMGADNFRQGVSSFLKEYEYKNAATPDLWRILAEFSQGLDITRIMDTWTRQMGFPVLSYTLNGNNQLVVTQKRFLSDPSSSTQNAAPSDFGYKWDVPIFYQTDKSTVQSKWLYIENASVTVDLPAGFSWVKLNTNQSGFYRVNYLPQHWTALANALSADVDALSASDRWGVIDDAFSLAAAGQLPYSTALDMIKYVKKDAHSAPWNSASANLGSIQALVYGTNVYPGFRSFIISLVEEQFKALGWNDTGSFLDKNLRSTILSLSCSANYADCLNGAALPFRQWIDDKSTYLPPNFRTLIYRYGIAQIGDATVWNTMWDRYTKETDPNEAVKLLYGLAFPKEPWLVQQYLELAKTDKVRGQDYFTVLEYISQNPVGLPIVWDFIRNEWEYLVDRFTTNNRYLGRMVNTVCSQFTTQLRLDEMKAFFAKYPDAGAGARAREQALETVQNNINWLKVNKQVVEDWLIENNFMSR